MTIKNILLLSCRSPFLDDSKIYCPLANLYLKSYVERHVPGVEVVVGDDEYDLENLDSLERFDAVGISIMTPQRAEAIALANAIKKRWPEKIVVAGGPHVKHYLSEMLDSPFDHLVPLDGEKALSRIVSGKQIGAVVRDVMTRAEIHEQPRPDRTSANAIEVIGRYFYRLGDRRATTMMTARGCPEQCTFCEDAMTQVKRSSFENIAAELADIRALGYGGVYIFDDLFAMSATVVRPICEELKRLDLTYRCNAQARYFVRNGEEMAELLGGTGCYEIAFGAESGSQVILDRIKKRATVEQNYLTVAHAKKHGIKVKAFMLLGLPGETWSTLADTEKFIRDSGIDDFQLASYMPFKGTQIRDDIDGGKCFDLTILPGGADGEVTGAYGIKGGKTAYEVRTKELSAGDIEMFREYLVRTYWPCSHEKNWGTPTTDKFFDSASICAY